MLKGTAAKIAWSIENDGLTEEKLRDMLEVAKLEEDKYAKREICAYVRSRCMRAKGQTRDVAVNVGPGEYVEDGYVKSKDRKKKGRWPRVKYEARPVLDPTVGLDVIFEAYCISGSVWFDDYMSAMEFYREPQARFWWPRRKVLEGKHRIATQIQEFIDDPEALYLGLSVPPGCGKTTLIKFLLSYVAGVDPQSANMYVSYSDGMVKMVYDSVVAMLTDEFEYRHGKVFNVGVPEKSAEFKTISYRADGDFPTIGMVSLGGSVTGRTRANRFLVTDDLVKNKEEARSPERLQKLFDDYTSTLTTRMIGDHVKQIQLGTIWSYYDPISTMKRLHGDDPRYRFIAIPVRDEETGESNFEYEHPDRYTKERIAELEKTLDSVDFQCLYMQNGIQKEGLAFPEGSLQFYNGQLPPGKPDRICFAADVAFGGGDALSVPFAYVYGEDAYIPDVIFNRGSKDITEPIVVARVMKHGAQTGRFEANNGGDFYADDVSKMLKEAKYHCNVTSKRAPTNMSKNARIEQYAPDIRRMYFLQRSLQSKEYKAFMDEVSMFSFTSKNLHDDAPDSLAMLAEYLFEKTKMVTVPAYRFRL